MAHSAIFYEQIVPMTASQLSSLVSDDDVAFIGVSNVFTANQKIATASNPTLTLDENNSGTDLFQMIDVSPTQAQIRKISTAGVALIDIDPQPTNQTSAASFRFFRSTNTSGTVGFEIYKGNNTATINALISGNGDSYFAADSGKVGIGDTTPDGKLTVRQPSTTGAIAVIDVEQTDLSEEFFNFISTVGAGNPIDTAALGTYYGKIRVAVSGVGFKFMPLYNT